MGVIIMTWHRGNILGYSYRTLGKLPVSSFFILALGTLLALPLQAAENVLEEIVVTAQKREQNVQDISVSITAFTGDLIRDLGMKRPRDLAAHTPGLMMNASNNGEADPVFTLRGIGMNSVASNQNPAINLYIDDVALPSLVMLGFQLFDMERIEVLKGPQGTLYGRNTTGGAIRFITRKPTHEFDTTARIDVADYEKFEFEGAIGGSLTETLAGRLAIGINRQQEGWQTLDTQGVRGNLREFGPGVDRDNGEVDRKGYRGSLLWTPNQTVDVLVTADYATDDSENLGFQHAGNVLADGSGGLCSFGVNGVRNETECATFGQVRQTPNSTPTTPGLEIYQDNDGDARTIGTNFFQGNDIDAESWGLTATVNWAFERFTLTSVTGYREFDRDMGHDQGGTPFAIHDRRILQDVELFSQEIRFSSNETWSGWNWQGGAYFSTDEINDFDNTDFRDHPGFVASIDQSRSQETTNVAVFGQAEWQIDDHWRLIGGLRYTEEEREFQYIGETIAGTAPSPVPFFADDIDSSELSGKIGVDYTYSNNLLLYGSVSRGFKAGGFPSSIAFQVQGFFPYEPETLHAYEAGFKSTLLDGKLRFNSAVYYYDWQEFQGQTAVDRQGLRLIVLDNAGDAEITGVEAELNWFPTEQLTLRLGFNWMDSEIVKGDHDGDTPAHAPDIMVNGIARYDGTTSMGGFKPFVQLDFSYQDDVQFILPNHPGATEDAYTILGARAGLRSNDGRWEIAAYAQNLTDKLYRTEVFGPGSGFLPGRIFHGPPRIVGVSLVYTP